MKIFVCVLRFESFDKIIFGEASLLWLGDYEGICSMQ